MPLPPEVTRRLAAPLRSELPSAVHLKAPHTLPVTEPAWRAHTEALRLAVEALATTTPSPQMTYHRFQDSVNGLRLQADTARSHVLALQPFTPFDRSTAQRLLDHIDHRLENAANLLESSMAVDIDDSLLSAAEAWRLPAGVESASTALSLAFTMEPPPLDASGQFRPEWVLQHYAHQGHELLRRLLPHLESLGIPWLTDTLAALTVVGEILACEDPISAYVAMEAMLGRILAADDSIVLASRTHLQRVEPAARRARTGASISWRTVQDHSADTESRAHALADCYKRVVEGPFRQLAWAMFCLGHGSWETPPTLGSLKERIVAAGGWLGSITSEIVITEVRNAQAHETLVWDGFVDEFVTEHGNVSPRQVAVNTQLALSFVAGCEAAVAAARFLDVSAAPPLLPTQGERGRMPTWRRVQAFFGTNRLLLTDANLNSPDAAIWIRQLHLEDINPCFQALVLSHRLMPEIRSFSVGVDDEAQPTIVVAAGALDACMPSWEFAVSNLDQIPLSTFLAANLDARKHHETASLAARSVAWIAVDDAVGIFDGSPASWDEADRALIDIRLEVVALAVQGASDWLASPSPRLRSVSESVTTLRRWIRDQSPTRAVAADSQHELVLLRTQWERWGPVLRHPLVIENRANDQSERQPRRRETPKSWAFRLL